MKKLQIIGEYIFEYFIITITLAVALALVLPFPPIYVGVVGYLKKHQDSRRIRDIFKIVKENIKILVLFTVFEIIILGFSGLNIYYFYNKLEGIQTVIFVLSCITMFIGLLVFLNGTIIILNMNVNFKQLLTNSILLVFGGILNSAYAIILTLGFLGLVIYYPFVLPVGLYFVAVMNKFFLQKNLDFLKAKSLKISVKELNEETNDDYLDEYGNIKKN